MSDFIDNRYATEVLHTMYQFSKGKKFTDFKIRAGANISYCHQAVICAKSVYFESICASGMREAALDSMVASDIEGAVLDAVVKFMYLGKTDITEATVVPILKAAEFIKQRDLKAACERFMIASLSLRTLSMYFGWARSLGLREVSEQCVKFAKKRFPETVRSEWLKDLSETEACGFFKADELQVGGEEEVLLALQIWLETAENNAKRKQQLERLFPCVRLQYCDREKLEQLSVDERVWIHLRHKILEFLQHGKHASATGPRLSYASLREHRRPPAANTPRPPPAVREKYQEKMVIVGGLAKGGINHDKLLCPGSTSVKAPPCINSKWYSVCASEESLIVSGGVSTETEKTITSIQTFNLSAEAWTSLPNMPNARFGHGSAVVERKLYLMSGRYREPKAAATDGFGRYDVNILDLVKRSWSNGPEMPVSVFRPGVVVVSRNILVIGGHTGKAWATQVCKLCHATNQWVICARMPDSARNFIYSTAAVDNVVYVLAHDVFLTYDVGSDQWSRLQPPVKPSFGCAMVLRRGQLVAMGGYDRDVKDPHDHLQVYDLFSKTWSLDESTMPYELCGHAAVMLKVTAGANA